MWTRIVTGIVLAPLVILLLLEGPAWGRAAMFVGASAVCVWELLAMALPDRPVERWGGFAVAMVLQLGLWLGADVGRGLELAASDLTLAALWALFAPALLVLSRPTPIATAALRVGVLCLSIIYLVVPLALGVGLVIGWPEVVLLLLATVWAGDTSAYFVGRAVGSRPLYSAVSPKKTIEGALGGVAGSALGAYVMHLLVVPEVTALEAIVVGAVGGAIAQSGDLFESLIKRACGVKDSGAILPGHGGMLDRIDGVIFAIPPFYAYFAPYM